MKGGYYEKESFCTVGSGFNGIRMGCSVSGRDDSGDSGWLDSKRNRFQIPANADLYPGF
jgi:hypothetical protein